MILIRLIRTSYQFLINLVLPILSNDMNFISSDFDSNRRAPQPVTCGGRISGFLSTYWRSIIVCVVPFLFLPVILLNNEGEDRMVKYNLLFFTNDDHWLSLIFFCHSGFQMYVCCTGHVDVLGYWSTATTNYVHDSHGGLPTFRNTGHRQDVYGIFQRDYVNVYWRYHNRFGCRIL